jgi:hypothetical protein
MFLNSDTQIFLAESNASEMDLVTNAELAMLSAASVDITLEVIG